MNWKAEILPTGDIVLVMDAGSNEYRWIIAPHFLWQLISLGIIDGYLDVHNTRMEIRRKEEWV